MPDQKLDLPDGYTVAPETPWDKTPMLYSVAPPTDADGVPLPPPPPLDERTVADLKAEIDTRNAGRPDGEHISKSGNKDDLIAALEADAAAHSPIPDATPGAGDKEN